MRSFPTSAVVAMLPAVAASILDTSAVTAIEAIDGGSVLVNDEIGTVAGRE